MNRLMAASALAFVLIAGCDRGSTSAPSTSDPPVAAPAAANEATKPAADTAKPAAGTATAGTVAQVHAVACGCSIESVGKCGNMIKVDDKYLPLEGDIGLGPMEFCGQEGLKAEVAGEVKDGVFAATSFKLIPNE